MTTPPTTPPGTRPQGAPLWGRGGPSPKGPFSPQPLRGPAHKGPPCGGGGAPLRGVVGQTILRCLAPKSTHLPNSDRHPIMRVNNIILFFELGSCNFEFF